MKLRDKLVVPPRKPVTLADWDPDDTHGFDKEPAIERIERSLARLDELQYLMYAEHRRALLVVLQGMDAAGCPVALSGTTAEGDLTGLVVNQATAVRVDGGSYSNNSSLGVAMGTPSTAPIVQPFERFYPAGAFNPRR